MEFGRVLVRSHQYPVGFAHREHEGQEQAEDHGPQRYAWQGGTIWHRSKCD